MARTNVKSKNKWALFLLILAGIAVGNIIGYLTRNVKFLSWLYEGVYFAIGDKDGGSVLTLDLDALVIRFGLVIKITAGSILGVIASVFLYKKL
jgi:hypothetical protein